MTGVFDWVEGGSPLIVSMPHSGIRLPRTLEERLTAAGRRMADTDWHIPILYDFLDRGDVSILKANYSRYVVDLNRFPDGAALYPGKSETEICPTNSFAGEALYNEGQSLTAGEIERRVTTYWQPYHQKLAEEIERVKGAYGFAILWDAHSIPSRVPRFFEGRLPDLNLGTADGDSCTPRLSNTILDIMREQQAFSWVYNGRFKGGAITRRYGAPLSGVHALQMEIAQVSYMKEDSTFTFDERKADKLRPVLMRMLDTLRTVAPGD